MNIDTQSAAPIRRPRNFIYIMLTEDNRCIASNVCGDCGITHLNKWSWIVGHIVGEFGCDPDSVHCIETDDGDKITIGTVPVAYLAD